MTLAVAEALNPNNPNRTKPDPNACFYTNRPKPDPNACFYILLSADLTLTRVFLYY